MLLFDLRRKITKLSQRNRSYRRETVSEQWRHYRRLWRFQHAIVLERSIEVGLSVILSLYKVVYISIKDLHAGYDATRWRNFLSNLPKNVDFDWSKSHEWWCPAVYNSVSKQGRWSFSSINMIICCIHIASKVCSNTCRGLAVRWCRYLQKRCSRKFNGQYIEWDS